MGKTIYLSFSLLMLGCWVGNFVKLLECDFESNYRCEAVHGIGLHPVFALVTVWFETDKNYK